MSRFPLLEAAILATLETKEEAVPPISRLAQEHFWQSASALQARGLVVADQKAGVVRRAFDPHARAARQSAEESISFHLGRLATGGFHWPSRPGVWVDLCGAVKARTQAAQQEYHPRKSAGIPTSDLRARAGALAARWRQTAEQRGGVGGAVLRQCAIDLEEALEETQLNG